MRRHALAAAAAIAFALAARAETCELLLPGSGTAATRKCLACHDGGGAGTPLHATHPVDVDYARAAGRAPFAYRRAEEAVARGVFLPEGMVRCTTCHDGRSRWKYRLALPPGAIPRPAVDPENPATYEGQGRPTAPLPPGSDVGRKALCLGCHALD
jgi:hypothetical protein